MEIYKRKPVLFLFFIFIFMLLFQATFVTDVYATTYTYQTDDISIHMDNNGRYWMRLQPQNIQVLYGDGSTSNTYINIDGTVKTFKSLSLKDFRKSGNVIEQTRSYGGVDITLRISTVNNGRYMKAELIFKNNNSYSRKVGGEFYWDTKVNGNDSSPFEFIQNGWRNYYNGKQITVFYKGTYNVVDASMVYAGGWNGSNPGWNYGRGYSYHVGQKVSTRDTAAAIWWDPVSLGPNQTRTVSTIMGIGDVNVPPTFSLTSPEPNSRYFNGESFHLKGSLNDNDVGDKIDLKYAIDNKGETTLRTFTSTGSSQSFDFNLTIPEDLSPGNHELEVWALDDKGGVSSVARIPFVREDFNIPGEPTFSNITNNSFRVNWSQNGNISGTTYELFDVTKNETVYSGTGTTYNKTGAGANTLHRFKTRAKNKLGRYSNYSSITEVYTLANQPLSKGYDNITHNSVRLLWSANGNSSYTNYHYEVRRKSDNALVAQGTVNGTSANVTGLTGGHENYRFYVRAKNGDNKFTEFTELNIPSLEVYQKSNYAKAEWAIEMLDEDVLIDASFEDGETYKPSFSTRFPVFEEEGISYAESQDTRYLQSTIRAKGWISKQDFDSGNYTRATSYTLGEKYSTYYKMSNGTYRLEHNKYTNGVQEFTNEDSYTGNKSYKIGKTIDRMGNAYWFPSMYTKQSYGTFPHTYVVENGVDLSLTFRAKTDNKSTISPIMHGGMASWTYPFHERYGLENPLVVNKAAKIGEKKIYIDGIEQLNENGIYYVCRKQSRTEYINHSYARILEVNKKEGYIVLQSGISEDFPVGYVLHAHVNRSPVTFGGRTINANDGWQLFSINSKVKDYQDYKSDLLGLGLWFYVTSEGNTYIDDVKLGFATKAELYRDGKKLYEGYLSDYDDYEAIDKAKPNGISKIEVGNTGNTINITFDEPEDYGTAYTYQVKAIKHNGISLGSEIKPITITSGIKGYSYVIDSKPNTVPDNVIEVTTPQINKTIDPNKKNYIHIKVIDNQGNVSDVYHQEINIPVLMATPVPEGDYIHLDWEINDTSKHYLYMVYKKAEGESEFQSIPVKDRIKVLEVYPYVSVLKGWTDAYGQGKITTNSVTIENFNSNPAQVWDYDVVVFGFSDSNSGKDLSTNAASVVEDFIQSGRGVLFGHDTLRAYFPNFNKLAKYANMTYSSVGWSGQPWNYNDNGESTIQITRKGFLTNYPWKIGDVGTILKVPYSHTLSQIPNGDVWMKYLAPNNAETHMNNIENFYLTTWNNVAMAQTGHSIYNGNPSENWATTDEQKLIINTLFYLAQISDQTSLDDHTGQDVTGPTKPVITDAKMINNGNTIHIEYTDSQDKGTKYYYYVEASAANANVTSNIAEATITTGLKGYSIVIDQNPNTVPDNVIETTELEYEVNKKFYQKFYVHVAAVDNVGNVSEVAHYECSDIVKPSLIVTGNPTNWTKENIVLIAKATDNESGVKGIKLPNGEWVYSDTATFEVTKNGDYVFTAEDNFGNQTTVTVKVTKIDKTPPIDTSIVINNNDLYTNNRDVVLTISAKDNATGVKEMRFKTENSPWSAWVPYATTYNYTMDAGFTHQGTNRVYVQFKDGVGNVGGDASDSIIFDNIAPTGEIIFNKNVVNTRNIYFTVNAYDINPSSADAISGLNSVRFRELQNNIVKQNWTSWEEHNFTRNWILSDGDGAKVIEMEIKDNAGNIGKVTKTIVLDTLFIKEALFTDIVNPPLGNPKLPTSEVVKVKKGYEFTFIVKTSGDPDQATYTFNGESGTMDKLTSNIYRKTLKVDINDETVDNEVLPINITVSRNDGTKKSTTLKVHIEGSAYDDYNINLTN